MKKINELKKKVQDNKGTIVAATTLAACVGGYVGILVWEHKTFKTVPVKDWQKMTGQSPFDELLDKPIVGAFATVQYEDGTVGIIENVLDVATRLGQTMTLSQGE